MHSRERLYSMDNLRATMMWLGIVLHVADLHVTSLAPLPWHDTQTSSYADIIVGVIHAFRMPVFFIVAGFFVSMLVERRGIGGMLANRARRIAVPFAVFWPLLFTVAVLLTTFVARRDGTPVQGRFDISTMPLMPDGTRFQTLHLWFLEMLMGFVILAAAWFALARVIPEPVRTRSAELFGRFAGTWWAFLPLALPLALISQKHAFGVLKASALFVPLPSEWAFNGLFFVFGLGLYGARHRLLPRYQALCWHFALGGAIALVGVIILNELISLSPNLLSRPWFWLSLIYNCFGWLMAFALLGAFSRYLERPYAALRYAADSSYWVYLVHIPVLVSVNLLIFDWQVPALLKMVFNIAVTSFVCLASYHLLVRRTVIGTLLNGAPAVPRASQLDSARSGS